MLCWLDCQLSPKTALWLTQDFGCVCEALVQTLLAHEDDAQIFARAAKAGAIIITKDSDFADLVALHGPPPQVILITVGNTSDEALRRTLAQTFVTAMALLRAGEPIVEIGDEHTT